MTVKKRKKKSSPVLNWVIQGIKSSIEKYIVDIPDLTPEQKEEIAKLTGVFVATTIKEMREKD